MRLESFRSFACASPACALQVVRMRTPHALLPCGGSGWCRYAPSVGVVAEGAGLIQSRYDSPVGFEVGAGRLVARYVDIGAVVTKEQKLAKLSDIDDRNRWH